MNTLLIIALVLFAITVIFIYSLFMVNTLDGSKQKKTEVEEDVYDDAVSYCQKLYDQGLHSELQRYAQRKLTHNYGDIELRRILAKSLMDSDNTQLAIMHYEALLSISPKDLETQEILAAYYLENGFKARAMELYEKIFINDQGNVNAVETLAKLYDESGKYDKSIEMHKLLLDAEVDETRITELKYALADLYGKIGDNIQAFEEYKDIYKNDPDNLEILMLLADLAYKNKYWQDCLGYYQKIITIVGDDFEILEKIAQLHVTLEQWQEAILAYKKLISLETPDSANYLYHQNELCNAFLKNGQSETAVEILKDLIIKFPQETSFMFTLAQAYAMSGEFQEGINLYNKLLNELPPEQSDIIIKYMSNLISAWAQDLFQKGEYNRAFDKFFEALKYNEENDEIYYQLGKCNYYIKSMQDAISHFKRAISIKPTDSRYYFGLGCAYDEMGAIKNSRQAFSDAVNIDPSNIKARIAYALSLTKELEYAKSVEQFLEVLKYIPDNADTLYNTALAYELIGDNERAIKYYKQAIDADPKHKEAKHNIELILGEPYESPNAIAGNDEFEEITQEAIPSTEESFNQTEEIETTQEITTVNPDESVDDFSDFDFDVPVNNDGSMNGSMFS